MLWYRLFVAVSIGVRDGSTSIVIMEYQNRRYGCAKVKVKILNECEKGRERFLSCCVVRSDLVLTRRWGWFAASRVGRDCHVPAFLTLLPFWV